MGIGEEESYATVETKVCEGVPSSSIEESVSTVNISSYDIPTIEESVTLSDTCLFEIPTESGIEETLFSQPCQLFDVIDNCSSKMVDTLEEDVTVAVNSSCLPGCSGQADDEGRDEKLVDCGSDTKCSGIESSHVEETVCIEDVSTTGVAVKSAVEEPEYLQTCQMLDAVDDCSRLPDLSGEDLIGIFNSLECFGQIDDVGRDDTCVDSRSEINCYGYVPSLITEDICDLNTDSFEIATGSVDACSSRRLDVLNLSGEDVSVALNSSTSVEFSGEADIEGRDDSRVDCGSETKCSSVGPSYSRRSSRAHKPIIQTQTKTVTRKCRKTTKVPCPDKNMEISFSGTRRKRSSVSKPARSSTWGILENVNRVFIENNELVVNEVQSHELQKAKGSVANTKRNKDRASGNSKGSIKSYRASSSCIRLKVKLGNEVIQSSLNAMFPTVAATSAPANGSTNERGTKSIFGTMPEFSSLINDIEDKMGNEVIGRHNYGNSSVNCEGGAGEYCDEDLEVHLTVKDRDGSVMLEKSVGATAGGYLGISSVDSGGVNTDPGTSPDSEVINLLQDAEVGSRCLEDLHDSVLTSNGISDTVNVNCKRGNCFQEDGLPGQEGINTAAPLNTCESRQRVGNGSDSGEALTSFNSADDLTISSSSKECSTDPLPLSTETEVGGSNSVFKIENDREDKTFCSLDVGFRLPGSPDSKNLPPSTKTKGQKLSKCSKSGGGSKGRSKDSDSARNGKGNACRKRENRRKSGNKTDVTKNVPDEASCKVEGSPETGKNTVSDNGTTNTIDNIESLNVSYLDAVSSGLGEQILPQRKAWVCCDDCHKWRRIPATLADSIGENSIWVCKDNMDKAFADCSIRQEKSNAEINAELELSDISGEEEASIGHQHYEDLECRPSKVPQPASFTCIPHNEYLHRNRKRQTIDEIMVCHCKPPLNGRMGCGDECLNRMLNIECVRGTCPCGDLCSNQQFQKREYAGMHWFPTGKKGYGLQLLDNVSKGQFLIEYVGEVLDMSAYEARQKQYASDGHKHFYFMTLNGSEVIDASAKGNVGRFINHSCDPNCRTEKWMINGEICIGLFALRDMKKGEEVTFDYNYVRVFGAAAKKCYCSSIHCQGYIGGDPSNTEVIVQGESDEEFPEPIMLFANGKSKVRTKNKISRAKRPQTEKSVLKAQNKIDESTTDAVQLQTTTQVDDCLNKSAPVVSELHSPSLEKVSVSGTEEISAQTEDVTSSSVSSVQEDLPMEDDSLKKCPSFTQRLDASTAKLDKLPEGITVSSKSKPETLTKRISSKLGHRMKTSRSSNSIKKGKVNGDSQNANKPQMTPDRPELQSIKTSVNGRFESVEVKLNELLDGDGGISKRKDAAKGYLKLLLLTAASGDSGNGEAIQSNRELSMILDALLKTKSRIVLTDVINKNGLRMLHNIMKQYRRDFKKIPILRKLLKILEYLAVREILTQEHINGGPPCPGMESFTESILSLTEHNDKQVHQIARGFRDKWIPRHLRRPGYIDRADGQEFHRGQSYNRFSASPNVRHDQGSRPSEAVDCVNKQAVPGRAPVSGSGVQESCSAQSTGGSAAVPRIRKRKSRWDQPAEGYVFPEPHPPPHKEQKTDPGLLRSEEEACRLGNSPPDDEMSNVQDDAPPGFSSPPVKPPPTPSRGGGSAPVEAKPESPDRPETATGHPQERFTSRIPVSYGIPLSIVKQFGASQAETPDTWTTAPGIPFYPFPPLPPNKKGSSGHPPPPHSDQPVTPSTHIPLSKPQISHKRPRGANDLGNRYFRQQKSNNSKIPPWLWKRNNNGWGVGNQPRNGVGAVPNNVGNSFRNMNCSEGKQKCSRVEKPGGNNCYQQPQPNQNHYLHHQH